MDELAHSRVGFCNGRICLEEPLDVRIANILLNLAPGFFLHVSSSEKSIRNKLYSSGRYSNGAMATSLRTNCSALFIGPVKGFGLVSENPRMNQPSEDIDMIPINPEELYTLLDFSIGGQAHRNGITMIVTGFDRQSLARSNSSQITESRLLS